MVYARDPLSVRFDPAARALLERAYDADGDWAYRVLGYPGPRFRTWAAAHGVNLSARDRWGEVRWVRAFKRSVFWQMKWYGGQYGLKGQPNLASGGAGSNWGAPWRVQWSRAFDEQRGVVVRIRLHQAGWETSLAGRGKALARGDNWIGIDGHPTDLQSTVADRDWEN